MIKLVLSDMDNTLIPLGEKRVSPRTIAAIHELMGTGVRFGPATGRDTVELLRFFDMDESCFQTGILSNGKRIRLDGSYVQMTLIPRDALERIDAALRPEPGMFLVCYPEQTNLLYPAYGVGTTDDELAYYARRTRFTGIAVDQIPNEDYIAATIACPEDPEHMERCRQIVADAAPDMRIASPISGWFDIMPQGVSKAAGLDVLLDALGITADEVVAFGDAENDLEILRKVRHSVAVANATDEVLATANYRVGAVTDEGVADALLEIARATRVGEMPAFLQ